MITEILYIDNSNLSFVVDNTQVAVSASGAAAPLTSYGIFENQSGQSFLRPNDNFTVLNVGYRLPFCFSPGLDAFKMIFQWWNPVTPQVNSFTEFPGIVLPEADEIFPISQFVNWEPLLAPGQNVAVSVASFDINISMINVPDSLNGATINIHPFMTVIHTLPLV